LEKDKQLHQREVEIQKMEREMTMLKADLKTLCNNDTAMM
jgi:hypothetical protein